MSAVVQPAPDPAAPDLLHIDLADVATRAARATTTLDRPLPHPEDALELQLMEQARRCASGDAGMPPRRELVAVALREAERHEWWRDQAEARERDLVQTLTLREGIATQLRTQRNDALKLAFELTAYAAQRLGCRNDTREVLARIRALGSGMLASDALSLPDAQRPAEFATDGGDEGDGA